MSDIDNTNATYFEFQCPPYFVCFIRRQNNMWAGGWGPSLQEAIYCAETGLDCTKKRIIEFINEQKIIINYIPDSLYVALFNEKSAAHWIKCECGAEKCKTTHSTWCPKFKIGF